VINKGNSNIAAYTWHLHGRSRYNIDFIMQRRRMYLLDMYVKACVVILTVFSMNNFHDKQRGMMYIGHFQDNFL